MSNARKGKNSPTVELFPFLAVLMCTMGALILLLVLISGNSAHQAQAAALAEVGASTEELAAARTDLLTKAALLEQDRDVSAEELALRSREIADLDAQGRQLRQRLAEMEAALAANPDQPEGDDRQLQTQIAALRRQIAETTVKVQQVKRTKNEPANSFAVIPYVGPNGTRRRPIYIECRADAVILQPQGIVLNEADFPENVLSLNPLSSAVQAAANYYEQTTKPGEAEDPYPLLLVRPDGIGAYYAARAALKSWGADFGYEFVEQDWQLKYDAPNPRLADMQRLAVQDARGKQRLLALAAPTTSRERRTGFRVAGSGGGLVRDDNGQPIKGNPGGVDRGRFGNKTGGSFGGTAAFGGKSNGATGEGGAGGGSGDGQNTNGQNTNGQYASGQYASGQSGRGQGGGGQGDGGQGGSGNGGLVGNGGAGRSGGGATAGPGGGRGDSNMRAGGGSGSAFGDGSAESAGSFSGGGQADAAANGGARANPSGRVSGNNGLRTGGSSGAGGGAGGVAGSTSGEISTGSPGSAALQFGPPSKSEGGATASASGGQPLRPGEFQDRPTSQERRKMQAIAEKRGANWALPGSPSSIALTRPIRVECAADHLQIVPERRGDRGGRRIELGVETEDAMPELISSVWDQTNNWGIAGKGMYWKPALTVQVMPGGEQRFQELSELLDGSGLTVKERKSKPLPPQLKMR